MTYARVLVRRAGLRWGLAMAGALTLIQLGAADAQRGEPATAAPQSAGATLPPAGLELTTGRATFAGTAPRHDVAAGVSLPAGQSWVPTANPRLRATLAVDPADLGLTVALMDAQGAPLGRFTPASTWLMIPRDRDLVWAVGVRGSTGRAVPDGTPTFEGLELWDAEGQRVAAIPAAQTGSIGRAELLDEGRIVTLGDHGLALYQPDGHMAWQQPSTAHSLKVDLGASVLALQSSDRASRQCELLLLREDGSVLDRLVEGLDVRVGLAGTSPDGQWIAVRRFMPATPGRWELSIRRLEAPRAAVATLEIDGGVEDAVVTEDGRHVIAQINVRRGRRILRVVRGMDLAGGVLFEYVPPHDALAPMSLMVDGTRIGIADSEEIQWVDITDR